MQEIMAVELRTSAGILTKQPRFLASAFMVQ